MRRPPYIATDRGAAVPARAPPERHTVAFSPLDLVTFAGFITAVITISLWASRGQQTSEDYFLAGRNLSWWLIGFSLIASNEPCANAI